MMKTKIAFSGFQSIYYYSKNHQKKAILHRKEVFSDESY